MRKPKKMTPTDVARIQSAVAKQGDGKVSKDSYVARVQRKVANRGKGGK